MTPLEIVASTVGPALATFYFVCRVYTLRLRSGDLGKDWDSPSVFCFAAVMGIVWPLTLLWLVARRPSREERRAAQNARVAKLVAETERRARELGVGS